MNKYNTRADLYAAVNHPLKNDSIADFRRDLDKALEAADRLVMGRFQGKYWAERAIAPLVEIGCNLCARHTGDSEYQIEWAGGFQ